MLRGLPEQFTHFFTHLFGRFHTDPIDGDQKYILMKRQIQVTPWKNAQVNRQHKRGFHERLETLGNQIF